MEQIKLWKIESDDVIKISKAPLDYEHRLEKWLIEDITILSQNLAIIGCQVDSPYGKKIDILAINSSGDLVIIELKRDKPDHEVIAHVLDSATWIKELCYDELTNILNTYGKSEYKDIEEFFSATFHKNSKEIELNSDHQMIIVGSEIDESTIRIINYLAKGPYYLNINAVSFNYYKDSVGNEFLAQSFVLPENNVIGGGAIKRKPAKSIIATLFELGKLKVGQKVYLKPAIDKGHSKDKVSATIVNTKQKCLQRGGDDNLYTFNGLRFILTEELGLKNVQKYWEFGVRYDWVVENMKNLSELLDE
jgi:Predicted nuclease of the RecB family